MLRQRVRFSMRACLIAMIVAVGALSFLFMLFGYSALTKETRASMQLALEARLQQGWKALERDAKRDAEVMARTFMTQAGFARKDGALLTSELNALLDGHNTIARIRFLDSQHQPIAESLSRLSGGDACVSPSLAMRGPVALCVDGDKVFQVATAPLQSQGHLEVVTALAPRLALLTTTFDTPLRVMNGAGAVLYQFRDFATLADEPGVVRTARALPVPGDVLTLEGLHDARGLIAQFQRTLLQQFMLLALLLAGVGYGALRLLERKTLAPMKALAERARGACENPALAGAGGVSPDSHAEIAEVEAGVQKITERFSELHNTLENAARTDLLTGLPNRLAFRSHLQEATDKSRRDSAPFALLIMDLDRFRDINGALGHDTGDVLLQQVALRLRAKLRESDTLARLSGDEFAVLLPLAGGQHAAMAARMLSQALCAPFDLDDQVLDIRASIGIALFPDHGVEAGQLVQHAEVAMYAAKSGGGGHALYDPDLDNHSPERLARMRDLRRAVQQEQFELHYQPKIDLVTGRVMGVEALLRWRHPHDGLTLPGEFIPMLEQTGLIRNVTPWVTNEAMAMSRRLQERGLAVGMSVNLSVRDLQNPHLADTLAEQLAVHHIDAEMIEFEVTESAIMTEPERSIAALTRLSEMGFRLAIDDFGTGYSSFAYLKTMPVGTLKVDKSFVIGAARDDNDAVIVQTATALGHSLDLKVVAEGVEDEVTLARLRKLGCDAAQGYFISRPLMADDLVTWLTQSSFGLRDTPVRLNRA